jgi:hypothetical protein
MSKYAKICGLAIMIFVLCSFAPDKWVVCTPPNARCNIMFPGTPSKKPDRKLLLATIHIVGYSVGKDDAYLFGWTNFGEYYSNFSVSKALEDCKNGMTKGADELHVIKRDYNSSAAHVEYVFKVRGMHVHVKLYMIHKMLYEIMYISTRSALTADATKFINSFKFLQ